MGQSSAVFDSTLFLTCRHLLVCKITDDYAAEQQIWRHLSAARIFALQKSLRVGCDGGTGVLIAEGEVPAQRNFQRKFALRRVGSAKFVVPPTIERSKVREHAQLVQPSVPGSLGCQRGRAPLFPKESREKPFEGFSLGNFFLTADAVLLCAAKKNSDSRWRLCRLTDMGCRAGVGTTRLAGFCQFSPDPWVTHSSKKPHTVGSGK